MVGFRELEPLNLFVYIAFTIQHHHEWKRASWVVRLSDGGVLVDEHREGKAIRFDVRLHAGHGVRTVHADGHNF